MRKTKLSIFFVVILATTLGFSTFSIVSAQENSEIPAWIKTAVGFWVNDQISDKEFLKAIEYFVENEMIRVPSDETIEDDVLINNLQILQSEVNTKIEQSRELVNLAIIQKTLKESNESFEDTGSPEEIIKQIEKRWQSSDPEKPDSIAYNLIHNSSADLIRSIMEKDIESESKFKYAEIFITNAFGANVAQSEKTSDYRQDDEIWWQKAKQNGIYLSEGGFDESAGVYASDVAIRILDEKGNFIGILKAVINVESVTNITQ